MEWVGPVRIPPMSTWARHFPEAGDTGGSDVLLTHSRYRCQGPGSGDPGFLNNLWTCVHLLLLSLISMLVCMSRCVCGCGRALGFRHHQACWVCPAWRRATPEEDDHTHLWVFIPKFPMVCLADRGNRGLHVSVVLVLLWITSSVALVP